MRKLFILLISGLIVLSLFGIPIATASVFEDPPEDNIAVVLPGGWWGSYPYQRNAMIGFDTDPAYWPQDNANNSAKDLGPEHNNYHLQGRLDSSLYPSDWLQIFGEDYTWQSEIDGRQGVIVLNHPFGTIPDGFGMTWFIDNIPEPRTYKHVYFELIYKVVGNAEPPLFVSYFNTENSGSWITGTQNDFAAKDLGDGWKVWELWGQIEPNPPYESIGVDIGFYAGTEGTTVYIDSWHVATECVPIPTTILLFGSGLFGIAGLRRKFNKS